MSRSYRTDKESVIAGRHLKRDPSGSVILPRIIVRKPRRGDVHPLGKQILTSILKLVPQEYLYGLRRIELRARQTDQIGQPFGCYRPSEKAIILYSLPMIWELNDLSLNLRNSVQANGGEIETLADSVIVRWPNNLSLSFWCWMDILMHELGHHFMHQYRHKNKATRSAFLREFLADRHARRYRKAFIAKLSTGRLSGGAVTPDKNRPDQKNRDKSGQAPTKTVGASRPAKKRVG